MELSRISPSAIASRRSGVSTSTWMGKVPVARVPTWRSWVVRRLGSSTNGSLAAGRSTLGEVRRRTTSTRSSELLVTVIGILPRRAVRVTGVVPTSIRR